MDYYILTGTSRGIGEEVAKQLLGKENYIFCISRNSNDSLIKQANLYNTNLEYFKYDLNDVKGLEQLMQLIFSKVDFDKAKGVYLLNNAGIVSPISPIEKCNLNEIIQNIQVNLVAPIIMVSLFIKYTTKFIGQKRVINISSGAGKKTYYGWSNYSTSKAALDMFTRNVALEQENKKHPVEILSFSPGVVDTDMQKEIRQTKKDDFMLVENFIKLKEDSKLFSPTLVAQEINKWFKSDDFKQGAVIDIRDYYKT